MRDLLEVLKVQRHDFMNHLQVISGYIQLKKYDRAHEYIGQVAEELKQASLISKLNCPEIISVVLGADLAAGKNGITVNTVVGSCLSDSLANGLAVAEVLREMLDTALQLVESLPGSGDGVTLEISEKGGDYIFQVSYRCRQNAESLAMTSGAIFLNETAAKVGGRFITESKAEGVNVMTLAVPVSGPR